MDVPGFVGNRVDPDESVVGEFHAIDRPAGIHAGIALIGGYFVMDVASLPSPFPQTQHDVAFASLWAGWGGRHFAGHDSIGPVRIHGYCTIFAEAPQSAAHHRTALADLDAMCPGCFG